MKKISFILILVISSINIYAQQDAKLIKSIEALRSAMVDPTKESLDALISENLSYGHSSGSIDTKEEFIQNLLTGKSDFVSIELSDQKIIVQKNTAIVRHNLAGKNMDQGKPGTLNLHVMTTWVKEGKSWKLLARQAVKRA
jgi:hypothetical protein